MLISDWSSDVCSSYLAADWCGSAIALVFPAHRWRVAAPPYHSPEPPGPMTSSLRGALSLHNGSSGETADQLCLPDRSCRCVFHSVSLARSREQLNRLTAGSKSFPAMSFVHADSLRKRSEEHTSEL